MGRHGVRDGNPCPSPSRCVTSVSLLLTDFPHLSLSPKSGDVHAVSSLAAHDVAVKSGALAQILIWTSIAEAISVVAISQMLEGSGRQVSFTFPHHLASVFVSDMVPSGRVQRQLYLLCLSACSCRLLCRLLCTHSYPFLYFWHHFFCMNSPVTSSSIPWALPKTSRL